MSEERNDVHADLRATMDSMAPAEPPLAPAPAAAPSAKAVPEPNPRPRDEVGRFAREQRERAQAAVPAKPVGPVPPLVPDKDPPPGGTPPAAAPAVADVPRAPATLKPATREAWATLPEKVREEMLAREGEVSNLLRSTAQHRKTGEAFAKAVEPYRQHIQGDPVQVVGTLMSLAVRLDKGTGPEKAQVLGHLIRTSGVDLDTLNQVLGEAPQQPAPQRPQGEFRDPRFDSFMQMMSQRASKHNDAKVSAFEKTAPHLDEPMLAPDGQQMTGDDGQPVLVREVAADFIEAAAKRGVALTLEQAYSYAVAQHPSLSKAMAQQEAVKAPAVVTPQARRAAGLTKSEPTAPPVGSQSGSMRDDIRAAADQLRRR